MQGSERYVLLPISINNYSYNNRTRTVLAQNVYISTALLVGKGFLFIFFFGGGLKCRSHSRKCVNAKEFRDMDSSCSMSILQRMLETSSTNRDAMVSVSVVFG